MLDKMKLRTKMIGGFVFVALFSVVIGLTSLILIGKMSRADQKLYTDSTVPLPELSDIAVSFQRMRVASRDFINAAGDAENRAKFERQIGDLSEEVTRTSELYEKGNLSPEMTTAFTEYKQARKAYDGYLSNIISLAKAGKDKRPGASSGAKVTTTR